MQIVERRRVGDVHVWAIDGGIDYTTQEEFLAEMQRVLDAGERRVVLDFHKLSYISSWGLGLLLRVHKRYKNAGADLKFADLHTSVGDVLRLSHLDRVFDLYPTVDDAIRSFAPAGPPAS
jgi:anti-sigma B factor antagonist